jgi:hypothetical protein
MYTMTDIPRYCYGCAQGLRKRLETGKKLHPFQAIHSFRKWFKLGAN